MAERAESELDGIERLFRRSGLPLFIEDYSAAEDIFATASPVLAAVFAAEVVWAVGGDLPRLAQAAIWTGAMVALAIARGVHNHRRGRRLWSLPHRVGVPWLAGFLLAPAAVALVAGGTGSLGLLLGNAAVLAAVALLLSAGLIAAVVHALRGLTEELGASLAGALRSLPLLVVFALVLFTTAETWQIFATMPGAFVVVVILLFLALGLLFIVVRLPGQVRALERVGVGDGPPLKVRQRLNVGLVLGVREVLQGLVVAAGVGLFFFGYGALTVGEPVYEAWGVTGGSWLVRPTLLGHPLHLSESLLRVSLAIASVCSLYYLIAITTDANYRTDFLDRVVADMGQVFEARARYLQVRAGGDQLSRRSRPPGSFGPPSGPAARRPAARPR